MLALAAALALAAGLPSVDDPVRTGHASREDAAVIIGLEDYAFIADVPFASRDAQAMYNLLLYTRGVPAERIHLLQGGGREQIIAAVRSAGTEVGPGGVVWVYFAGHGAAAIADGRRLLLGDDVRADPGSFEARAIPVDEVEALAGAGGGEVMMVLDTCYAGAGRNGEELFGGKRFAVPAQQALARGSTRMWTAAAANELSGPLPGASHGAFTWLVVGALEGWADGEIDGQRDGTVTGAEARAYVARSMAAVQQRQQTPSWTGGDDLVLTVGVREKAPSLGALTTPAAAPAPQATATLSEDDRLSSILRSAGGRREAEAQVRAEATSTWATVHEVARAGGEDGRYAISAFIDRYSSATVEAAGVQTSVAVPEVDLAREWLDRWDAVTSSEERASFATASSRKTWLKATERKESRQRTFEGWMVQVGGVARGVLNESSAQTDYGWILGNGGATLEANVLMRRDGIAGVAWSPGAEAEGFRQWFDAHGGVGDDGVYLVVGGGVGLGGKANADASSAVYGVHEYAQMEFYTESDFHLFFKIRLEQRQLFAEDALLHATVLGAGVGFGFGGGLD